MTKAIYKRKHLTERPVSEGWSLRRQSKVMAAGAAESSCVKVGNRGQRAHWEWQECFERFKPAPETYFIQQGHTSQSFPNSHHLSSKYSNPRGLSVASHLNHDQNQVRELKDLLGL